jgi:putative cell wall-binding protein
MLLAIAMVLTMTPDIVFAADNAGSRVNRISGGNRYDTSAKTALDAYPDGAETVIIARGDDQGDFADGLAASYLAGLKKAPILLTSPGELPQETENAVKKLKAETAYVLGGELAVSPSVAGKLKNIGLKVERIQGANRYATAAAIAAQVVSGSAPADSLVAGPLAFSKGYPILPVSKGSIPDETKQAIADLGIKTIDVVGGENVVNKAVYDKLGAHERYSGQRAAWRPALPWLKNYLGHQQTSPSPATRA